MWGKLISGQLRKPSGLLGRTVIARGFRRLNASINQSTLSALELVPGDRVIEVGFGPGDLLGAIIPLVPDGSVTGVDFSPDMVALCAKRFRDELRSGHLELECADAGALPYGDAQFTKACTVNTIYFWPEPQRPLGEFHRVLTEGGRLVVAFSPRVTMERLGVAEDVFTLYDPEEVLALLREVGFGDVRMVTVDDSHDQSICAIAVKAGAPSKPRDAETIPPDPRWGVKADRFPSA